MFREGSANNWIGGRCYVIMVRQRSPDRNKAYEIFKEHNGNITIRKIAELLSTSEKVVNEKTVGGWKSKDEWIDKLNGVLQKETRSTQR